MVCGTRFVAAALLATVAMPAHAEKTKDRVTVEGNTYTVKTEEAEVRVENRVTLTAIRMGRSVERRKQMLEAVRIVTGCEISDPFWVDGDLVGGLECSV